MKKNNIFITAINKLRPGSEKGFRGISIIDTSFSQRSRSKGVEKVVAARNKIDPESTSYPIIVASSNLPPRYPSGILSRTDPKTGNLPRYERDDEEILKRLFGIGTIYYDPEIREI